MEIDALRALRNAIRCDMAYMEPTLMFRGAQARVTIEDGVQYFAGAGTNDRGDVLNDLAITWRHRDGLGKVRNGFADAFDPLRDLLVEGGVEALGLNPELPTVVVCHSLGVPVLQFLVPRLVAKGMKIVYGEGFGSPTGWKRPAWAFPTIPWTNYKNAFDVVAGRPWLLFPGTAGENWLQIDAPTIRPGMRHPAAKTWPLSRPADNHRLRGKFGYIQQLGNCVGFDWRSEPWAREWAVAVVAYEDRGEKPLLKAIQ